MTTEFKHIEIQVIESVSTSNSRRKRRQVSSDDSQESQPNSDAEYSYPDGNPYSENYTLNASTESVTSTMMATNSTTATTNGTIASTTSSTVEKVFEGYITDLSYKYSCKFGADCDDIAEKVKQPAADATSTMQKDLQRSAGESGWFQ